MDELNNETARDISIWAATSGNVTTLISTKANERAATLSGDGRWLAYVSDVSGRDEVYIRPLSGPGTPVPVSREGGTEPVWSRRGNELFFRKRNQLFSVTISGESLPSAPRLLLTGPYVQAPAEAGRANYDVGPDGQSFVMVRAVASSAAHLHIVQSWFEHLRAIGK